MPAQTEDEAYLGIEFSRTDTPLTKYCENAAQHNLIQFRGLNDFALFKTRIIRYLSLNQSDNSVGLLCLIKHRSTFLLFIIFQQSASWIMACIDEVFFIIEFFIT